VQTDSQLSSRPTTALQLLAEAAGGVLAGLACAALLGLIAARLFAGTSGGWGDLVGALLGSIAGYIIGVTAGVTIAGRRLTGRGSAWLPLIGSVLGVALVMLAAEPLGLNRNTAVMQAALAIVPPICATLAFNIPRMRRA
jgi:hypothetical protein